MSEPDPIPSPWSTVTDVVFVLGKLGPRVQANADIDLPSFLSVAHTEALDRLTGVYGAPTLPTFTGDALAALRWVEAKLAAADILDMLRTTLGDDQAEVPERLRRSAWQTIDGGLPGFRPGDPVPGEGGPPLPTWTAQPRHTSATPVSNFANPYDELTLDGISYGWPVLP